MVTDVWTMWRAGEKCKLNARSTLLCIIILVLCLPIHESRAQSSPPPPNLSCSIRNPLEGQAHGSGQPIRVGSLRSVDFNVELTFPRSVFRGSKTGLIPSGYTLPVDEPWSSAVTNAPGSKRNNNLEIDVFELKDGGTQPIPFHLTTLGGGLSYDKLQHSFSLYLPKKQTREDVRKTLADLKAKSEHESQWDKSEIEDFETRLASLSDEKLENLL